MKQRERRKRLATRAFKPWSAARESILSFQAMVEEKRKQLEEYFIAPLMSRYLTRMLFDVYFEWPKQLLLTYTKKD